MRTTAGLALLLCARADDTLSPADPTAEQLSPLSELEWNRYLQPATHSQPIWPRHDYTMSTPHVLLERAATTHQQGELDKAVQILKQLLRSHPNNGEAYAMLSKVLTDQGKHQLADRAMAKATRIHNDELAQGSLF
jgi:cytochrome c-type biogenesis protein CcmH/NrfG